MERLCAVDCGQGRYTYAISTIAYNISVANRYTQTGIDLPIVLKRVLVKIGGSLRLTIPPEVAEILKATEGDEIEFSTNDGEVIIRKSKG
jgi:AbrB family looped-hinge helix DNA binding protein